MRFLLALIVMALPCSAFSEKRAFILSNSIYAELADLQNTHSDADAYVRTFTNLGYTVEAHRDLDRRGTLSAFLGFLDTVDPGDEVIFVYSGHGWSNGAINYIVPTNVPRQAPQHEAALEFETIPIENGVSGLLDLLAQKNTELTIAIIDACRNTPFAPPAGRRSFGMARGLQVAPSSQGSFVIYSAGQGQEALDRLPGDDPNQKLSVFTRNFVDQLKPGVYLHEAVLNARVRTTEQAKSIGHRQTPAYYDQTVQRVCLAGDCSVTPVLGQCDALWDTADKSAACYGYEAYMSECADHIFGSVARAFVERQCQPKSSVVSTAPDDKAEVLACLELSLHPDQNGLKGAAAALNGIAFDDIPPEAPLAC
ncbi:MAG: caspase family protein, partial [Rhodobacteraceae bacterium]|nr:caspase family protein [Paracoccaceae bacterium]